VIGEERWRCKRAKRIYGRIELINPAELRRDLETLD